MTVLNTRPKAAPSPHRRYRMPGRQQRKMQDKYFDFGKEMKTFTVLVGYVCVHVDLWGYIKK